MTHLTLTGYYAGHTLCDHPRNEHDQYLHVAYAPITKLKLNLVKDFSPLCDICLKVWEESFLGQEED